jgi:galactokinase
MEDLRNPAFEKIFGHPARYVFSAPGRTELSGNHTDHQHGRVLAAAVNLDTRASVAENGSKVLRVASEGYPVSRVWLDDLAIHPEDAGTTPALIRGVASRIASMGYALRGFDACVSSSVLPGSGLSSSAAFEVLIGTILNVLFCQSKLSAVEVAQIAQYAENVHFGKPSGLMDQTASSVGGILSIDFADPASPVVERVDFDFAACGHALCILDSGADHADLTDEYAAIPHELAKVCAVFGKKYLREVSEADFWARLKDVREAAGDRAALRAMHVYRDNERVSRQVAALKSGNFDEFLALVTESGHSSWMYLQNVIPLGAAAHQQMALTLALAEKLLGGRGAYRVHGGGFAGTVLAFVPLDMLGSFRRGAEAVLGEGRCHVLSIRKEGGILEQDWQEAENHG